MSTLQTLYVLYLLKNFRLKCYRQWSDIQDQKTSHVFTVQCAKKSSHSYIDNNKIISHSFGLCDIISRFRLWFGISSDGISLFFLNQWLYHHWPNWTSFISCVHNYNIDCTGRAVAGHWQLSSLYRCAERTSPLARVSESKELETVWF